jgi:hypothetical protein
MTPKVFLKNGMILDLLFLHLFAFVLSRDEHFASTIRSPPGRLDQACADQHPIDKNKCGTDKVEVLTFDQVVSIFRNSYERRIVCAKIPRCPRTSYGRKLCDCDWQLVLQKKPDPQMCFSDEVLTRF